MRELAIKAEVHPSLVSRVLSGKRQPTVDFLFRIGQPLGVDPRHLLLAAGRFNRIPELDPGVEAGGPGTPGLPGIGDEVRQLAPYIQYAQTGEGEAEILDRLGRSLKRLDLGSAGPMVMLKERLWALFRQFRSYELAGYRRALAGGALLYFMAPVDAIPDYLPLVGFLDDLSVASMVWTLLEQTVATGGLSDTGSLAQQ